MRVILGLGNPLPRYVLTRHNVGMMAVGRFASQRGGRFREEGGPVEVARCRVTGEEVIVARPRTYMNLSGLAAAEISRSHGTVPEDFIVVYDDIALPLGRLRLREKGTAGGHKGMQSVIDNLGTSGIPRLRLGIQGAGASGELSDYVLDEFESEEWPAVDVMIDRAGEALAEAIRTGLPAAASRFNRSEGEPGFGAVPE